MTTSGAVTCANRVLRDVFLQIVKCRLVSLLQKMPIFADGR